MFDRDEHPGFAEAIDLAIATGIRLAVSDPFLELWFLLHFKDQTAFLHRHDAQRQARALLKCDKALTPTAAETLAERYEQAKERAVKLEDKHHGDGSSPRANPSSGVWRLIDEIRTS